MLPESQIHSLRQRLINLLAFCAGFRGISLREHLYLKYSIRVASTLLGMLCANPCRDSLKLFLNNNWQLINGHALLILRFQNRN